MIEIAKKNRIAEIANIISICYGSDREVAKQSLARIFSEERTFIWTENSVAVAQITILDVKLSKDGSVHDGFAFYRPATLPAYRGKGIMSTLVTYVEVFCRQHNADFVAWIPEAIPRGMVNPAFMAGRGFRFVGGFEEFSCLTGTSTLSAKPIAPERFLKLRETALYDHSRFVYLAPKLLISDLARIRANGGNILTVHVGPSEHYAVVVPLDGVAYVLESDAGDEDLSIVMRASAAFFSCRAATSFLHRPGSKRKYAMISELIPLGLSEEDDIYVRLIPE